MKDIHNARGMQQSGKRCCCNMIITSVNFSDVDSVRSYIFDNGKANIDD